MAGADGRRHPDRHRRWGRAVGGAGSPEQRSRRTAGHREPGRPGDPGHRLRRQDDRGRAAAGRQFSSPDSDDETPLSWQLVDQDDAATGLRDGTYYGVLTIPKDFSAGITSTSGSDPKQAELTLVSDDAASAAVAALAQLSVNQAARTMGDQVTNNYVDAMLTEPDHHQQEPDQLGEERRLPGQLRPRPGQLQPLPGRLRRPGRRRRVQPEQRHEVPAVRYEDARLRGPGRGHRGSPGRLR